MYVCILDDQGELQLRQNIKTDRKTLLKGHLSIKYAGIITLTPILFQSRCDHFLETLIELN